jgi:hypothetical protein
VKAAYLDDATCNIKNAPEVYRDAAQPVFSAGGREIVEWVIPAGTVVEGDEALLRVGTGQAAPIDDECAAACGMTSAQLDIAQRAYRAAMAGIRGKKDHELFMAGVIDGYAPGSTDEKPIYQPGKNYQKWLDAKAAVASKDEEI